MKYPWNSTTKVIKYGKIDARLFFPFPNWVIFFSIAPPPPLPRGANRYEYTALLHRGEKVKNNNKNLQHSKNVTGLKI